VTCSSASFTILNVDPYAIVAAMIASSGSNGRFVLQRAGIN
jgi:hypothetical protein